MPKQTKVVLQKQMVKKKALIEQLKKTPVVSIACQRVSIGRTTFYTFKKEDAAFAKEVETAMQEGFGLINDLAESKLIALINKESLGAIIFWLKTHHETYRSKIELQAIIRDQHLSSEQEAIVLEALQLSSGQMKKINIPHHADGK